MNRDLKVEKDEKSGQGTSFWAEEKASVKGLRQVSLGKF